MPLLEANDVHSVHCATNEAFAKIGRNARETYEPSTQVTSPKVIAARDELRAQLNAGDERNRS